MWYFSWILGLGLALTFGVLQGVGNFCGVITDLR